MNRRFTAFSLVGVVLLLGGCSLDSYTEPYKDAPRSEVNDKPAEVLTMPDGFSNVAAKCDGTTKVYVIYKGDANRGSVAVSANDPSCK